jgi:uncharacterized protein YciI
LLLCRGFVLPADDGGLFLYEAPDLAAAKAVLAQDPYVKHGVAAQHELHERETQGVRPELLRVTGPARKGP